MLILSIGFGRFGIGQFEKRRPLVTWKTVATRSLNPSSKSTDWWSEMGKYKHKSVLARATPPMDMRAHSTDGTNFISIPHHPVPACKYLFYVIHFHDVFYTN